MKVSVALTVLPFVCVSAPAAHADVSTSREGSVVTSRVPTAIAGPAVDYRAAKALPPQSSPSVAIEPAQARSKSRAFLGFAQAVPGAVGSGTETPVPLAGAGDVGGQRTAGPTPYEYGTSNQPYTTSRVDAYVDQTSTAYPFRAAGKLFFVIGGTSYYCSASLIKPGVLVTAAHCLAAFGKQQFYSGFSYVPAFEYGHAPYGVWNVQYVTVPTAWYKGTDACATKGVVCADDVGVLVLQPKSGRYAGAQTGYFGYAYNGYGFTGADTALIDELGYDDALDGARTMQRSESTGFVAAAQSNNTVIGSLQANGSDGAPWVINLGVPPTLASGTTTGTDAVHNLVVGVTSWTGAAAAKQQGASPFTSANIVGLIAEACGKVPSACQ